MNRTLERRIRRLEQAAGGRDDELVEHELSDKSKGLLRAVLTGLTPPEELEAVVQRTAPGAALVPSPAQPRG